MVPQKIYTIFNKICLLHKTNFVNMWRNDLFQITNSFMYLFIICLLFIIKPGHSALRELPEHFN